MKIYSVLIVLLSFFQTQMFAESPLSFKPDTLQYSIKNFNHFSGKCEDTSCVTFVVEYPLFEKTEESPISDTLNLYINSLNLYPVFEEKQAISLEEMAKNLDTAYNTSFEEMPLYALPWELYRTTKVILNSPSFVSLYFEEFSFFGGAHPNSGVYLHVYDVAQNKSLLLDDILLPKVKEKFEKVGERYFRITREISAKESLENAGFWFENNLFRLNDNFAFTEEGIRFYFNSYEIGPYVMGPTDFTIPYKDIMHFLKNEYTEKLQR